MITPAYSTDRLCPLDHLSLLYTLVQNNECVLVLIKHSVTKSKQT